MKKNNIPIDTQRSYNVVKHNDLIQKSRYSLTVPEQKMIVYLISKIQLHDTNLNMYEFKINEFCEICGIDEKSGGNYTMLKETVLNLSNKGFWVNVNGEFVSMRWIEKARISPKSGNIKIKLDDDLKPYLLELKEKFTSYSLYFILAMKSKYSIRMYELLKSYQNLNQCEFEIERLKKMLDAETYDIFANFRMKVIDIAIREINTYSDIKVSYSLEKLGKMFNKIKFLIAPKHTLDFDESMNTWKNIEEKLNPKD